MRRDTVFALLVLICFIGMQRSVWAQSEWMWLEGSSQTGQPGAYGTLGVPSSSNIPGARRAAAMWVDQSGKHWFLGGLGYDSVGTTGYLNDLWTFDVSALQWAWMGGSNTVPKVSGSILGQPGVYGSLRVSAAANIPGGRDEASGWIDGNGNFWLFGGRGFDSQDNDSLLNDLWLFNPSTGQWTWMGGSNTDACTGQASPPCGQAGVYGTQGVASSSNVPGGRWGASSWTDKSGKFWLFGGFGFDSTDTYGDLNDLWMFDPSTQEWTWVGGSNLHDQAGVYGTLGVAAAGNIPGGRGDATASIDSSGNVWLFGGLGNYSNAYGELNDLWAFNSATSEWTWMSGNNTLPYGESGYEPVLGTLGVFSPSNNPGSLQGPTSWIDGNGNVWLLGGYAIFAESYYNNIWEFEPSLNEWAWMGGSGIPSPIGPPGVYGTQGVPNPSNLPGGRSRPSLWLDGSGNLWLFGGWGCGVTTCGDDALNDLWVFGSNFNLQVTPSVSVSPSQSSVGAGQTLPVVISVAGGPIPTGSVTLTAGSFTSPPTTLTQGSATIDVPAGSFSLGPATLTATYTPDTAGSVVYKGASGTASVTVVTSTYSMAATKVALSPGGSGTSTLTVSSSSGYAGTISFTCAVTSSPSGAVDAPTCASSGSATLSASTTSATATVTITTTGASSSAIVWPKLRGPKDWNGFGIVAVLLLSTCLAVSGRRRRSMSVLGVVLLSTMIGGSLGCGGSSTKTITNPGTTPGAYTITVTGTGNDASATKVTATFTLTVS